MQDKGTKPSRWGWLRDHMPGVQRLLAEKRRAMGDHHVSRCWEMGVNQAQPGWFFAREGPLAVGVPWPEIADVAGWQVTPTQALVILRKPEASDGA